MNEIIKKLKNKENLTFEESKSAFESMMSGKVKEEQIHDFLTFSSAKGGHLLTMGDPKVVDPTAVAAIIGNMIGMDPPEHQVYRKMVSPGFSPKAVRSMEHGIRNKVKVGIGDSQVNYDDISH